MSELRQHIDTKRLFDAIAAVLESDLEEILKLWIDDDPFGKTTKGTLEHRFDETIEELLWEKGNLLDLGQLLGLRDLKLTLKQLNPNCKYDSADKIEKAIRFELSIPPLNVKGRNYYRSELDRLIAEYDSNPSAVATDSRQFFERLLREVALLAASTPLCTEMLTVLKENEEIKLPKDWGNRNLIDDITLSTNIKKTSSGDLGFFIILLGKTSKMARSSNSPQSLLFAKPDEVSAFHRLAEALTAHTHFKPGDDKDELKEALIKINVVVGAMADRKAIPNAAVLIESTESIFGKRYRGRDENGNKITIRSDDDIPLGKRILFTEVSNPIHRLAGWVEVEW